MSAIIIGSPLSGKKVLRRQNYQKEINGLETITETYKIRTIDRDVIAPQKDTIHSSFSSSTKTYDRMVVETISFSEEDGGLTDMNVVYVGLTSSTDLPKPIVRLIPTNGAGIYGPPLTIEIEFVTDASEQQIASGGLTRDYAQPEGQELASTNNARIVRATIPPSLNGVILPGNPRSPFQKQLGILGGYTYWGYAFDNASTERRGQFLVARVIFREKQTAYGDPLIVAAFEKV
jgi:hypothetical protein